MALKYVVIVVVVFLFIETPSALTLSKRSLDSNASANASTEGTAEEKEVCQGRTPCGWAVYNRSTRFIDYFMKNKCECGKDKTCVRDDDDISITAFVYRCKIDNSSKNTS